ncbi:hypothetical protein QLQ12_00870 [Actinoplanes sp. NEAU-A12]|uniref:ABC transporter ATP-binding protein n=1 Tax=Actinoplanes sandaracinus TaxID=3045177 RepID=A0ABT6WBP9_9ACTN|nr:hypothetical protein [Actinoplanes sandaracinus]MDI6097160.1 hypothetical protein [Actinoplanes sandaracinus]
MAEPRVVVLDEATSSLDLRSELRVEAAIQRLLEGRTAILVAHRLSTARRADRVIVVDAGGIVEQGHPRGVARRRRPLHRHVRHLGVPRVARPARKATVMASGSDVLRQ